MSSMPPVPRVKVCGLTRAQDARVACAAGADAIGLVHHTSSPRHVEVGAAKAVVSVLPPEVLPVVVVVDRQPHEVLAFARLIGARAVQLCGAERPEDWVGFELPILRRLAVEQGAQAELERWRELVLAFVLDHPAAPGGTGLSVALEHAAELARRAPSLLAGGLDDLGVGAAVRAVNPHGVDASSRLESAPGIKDPVRVGAFVHAARTVLAEVHP